MKKRLLFFSLLIFYTSSARIIHTTENESVSVNNIEQKHSINWLKNVKQIFRLAKKEKKLIMVDISKSGCPPCIYLDENVYTDINVVKFVNKNFVPAYYLTEKDKIPFVFVKYFPELTPTLLFIKPDGKLFYSFVGARNKKTFLLILKKVIKEYNEN